MSGIGINRRDALRLLAAGAGTVALAGCAPASTGPAPAGGGSATPKRGGELKISGAPGFDLGWDPHGRASTASTSDAINSVLYDSLTEQVPDGSIQPALAESWAVS